MPDELKQLERRRRDLARAGDATGLDELAAHVEAMPASPRRDRLVYAARQNAAYARRNGVRYSGNRGLAIGAVVLTLLLAAGIAAIAIFGDWETSGPYSIYNDRAETVQVWSCDDEKCTLRDEAGTAGPGEAVPENLASEGDRYLVSSDESGDVIGCVTLPAPSTGSAEVVVNVSDAGDCPPGAPTSVG